MRISDWSSDVCSSDLRTESVYPLLRPALFCLVPERAHRQTMRLLELAYHTGMYRMLWPAPKPLPTRAFGLEFRNPVGLAAGLDTNGEHRSEEHTSELQSLLRTSYAVFCLKKKKKEKIQTKPASDSKDRPRSE